MQATMPLAQTNIGVIPRTEADESDRPQAVLEQMFVEHKDLVFRAAYRVTGNSSDAEDVLQTVFLRLARQPQLPEIDNVRAYLHRASVNVALDLLRRKKEAQLELLADDPMGAGPESAESSRRSAEIRDALRQALTRLSPRSAEMFVLRFIEEYDNRDIARMMNTSPAVVAVMLHRTRARLKKEFKAMTMTRGRQ